MKPTLAALAATLVLTAPTLPAHAANPGGTDPKVYDHHACFTYGGSQGDCTNTGHESAAEFYGCETGLDGRLRYAWAGEMARGYSTIHFTQPHRSGHNYADWTPQHKYEWHVHDAGGTESGPHTWVNTHTDEGFPLPPSWLYMTDLECCACDTPMQAKLVMGRHIDAWLDKHPAAQRDYWAKIGTPLPGQESPTN